MAQCRGDRTGEAVSREVKRSEPLEAAEEVWDWTTESHAELKVLKLEEVDNGVRDSASEIAVYIECLEEREASEGGRESLGDLYTGVIQIIVKRSDSAVGVAADAEPDGAAIGGCFWIPVRDGQILCNLKECLSVAQIA